MLNFFYPFSNASVTNRLPDRKLRSTEQLLRLGRTLKYRRVAFFYEKKNEVEGFFASKEQNNFNVKFRPHKNWPFSTFSQY